MSGTQGKKEPKIESPKATLQVLYHHAVKMLQYGFTFLALNTTAPAIFQLLSERKRAERGECLQTPLLPLDAGVAAGRSFHRYWRSAGAISHSVEIWRPNISASGFLLFTHHSEDYVDMTHFVHRTSGKSTSSQPARGTVAQPSS